MAEPKNPHRERIEELGRMNTIPSERPWHDWKPGTPPKHDHFTHDNPPAVDDEHPDKPDRDQAARRSFRIVAISQRPPARYDPPPTSSMMAPPRC